MKLIYQSLNNSTCLLDDVNRYRALSISSIVYVNNIDVSVLLSPNLYRLETIILAKSFLFIGILMVKYFKLFSQISKNDFIYIGIPICTNILSLLIIFKQGISNLDIELIDNFNLILISFDFTI